jgi:hypothetical protein
MCSRCPPRREIACVRQATGCDPCMTLDCTLSGRPCSHGEAAGVKMTPPLVARVGYAACAVAWVWTGARGPTAEASRARGVRRKRWRKRSRCARPNI